MTEIQLAAQTDAPVTGIIPVTLNLSSIELIYSKGAVTHVDVYPPACMSQSFIQNRTKALWTAGLYPSSAAY